MKITAHFHGILADWVGTRSAVFELADDATLAALINEIKYRFGETMPGQLWDREKDTFHKKVRAFRDGKALASSDCALKQGQELTFYLFLAGG